jgi:F-type H+-transporting ATPase subunit delta
MAVVLNAASRESLASLISRLDAWVDAATAEQATTTSDELFAVTRLLAGERSLRRLLGDSSSPEQSRTALVAQLLGGKIAAPTVEIVQAVAAARWSATIDLVEAGETLARRAAFGVAEKEGSLDDVEDELFRFGRILDREPQLATLLADTTSPVEGRLGLLDTVLAGKVGPVTASLLRQTVRLPRGRHLDVVAEQLAEQAAQRRDRSVAKVRTPVALTAQQEQKLADTLGRLYGRPISLQVELDPAVLGGLHVQVGNEVIDGSVAGKLAAARRALPS